MHSFDSAGKPHSPEDLTSPGSAKLTSATSGVATPGPGSGNEQARTLEVSLNSPGLTLVSLQVIGRDQDGSTYIALETTKGSVGDEIDLKKSVRKYAPNGTLLGETDDLPLSYYVPPVDELREQKGTVYQLMTGPAEVRINAWKMN
jgi:hypothetical protein